MGNREIVLNALLREDRTVGVTYRELILEHGINSPQCIIKALRDEGYNIVDKTLKTPNKKHFKRFWLKEKEVPKPITEEKPKKEKELTLF